MLCRLHNVNAIINEYVDFSAFDTLERVNDDFPRDYECRIGGATNEQHIVAELRFRICVAGIGDILGQTEEELMPSKHL